MRTKMLTDPVHLKMKFLSLNLIQTRYEKGADIMINFPPKLDCFFAYVLNVVLSAEARPTDGSYKSFEDLKPKLAEYLDKLQEIFDEDLNALNELIRRKNIPPIIVPIKN